MGTDCKCVIGRPHLHILNQCKLLPSHCELHFMFERSTNLFSMSQAEDQDYSVVIRKTEMSLRQVVVRDEVMEVHNTSVVDPQMGPFNYPVKRARNIKVYREGKQLQNVPHT